MKSVFLRGYGHSERENLRQQTLGSSGGYAFFSEYYGESGDPENAQNVPHEAESK